MESKKFFESLVEGVLTKVIVGALALGSLWWTIYNWLHQLSFWLYGSAISAALLFALAIILIVSGIRRKNLEGKLAEFSTQIEAHEMQLDLVKGILCVYVDQLRTRVYNDQHMRIRSMAEDLPPTFKLLMSRKWYDQKTETEIDTFIADFLTQIDVDLAAL